MTHYLLSSLIITGKVAAVSESLAKESFYFTEAKVAFIALLASNGQIHKQILANKATVLMGYNMIFPSLFPAQVCLCCRPRRARIHHTHAEPVHGGPGPGQCPLETLPTSSSVSVNMFRSAV